MNTAVTPRQLREISASYNLDHSDANVKSFLEAVCESLCFSGGSHTFDTGLVLNPHDHSRSASGSSSGSAALAASIEDVALLLSAIAREDGLDPRQKGVKSAG